MKVSIITDIEGVAGVSTHVDHSYPTGLHYPVSKRLLTAEVNAAVEGLLAAGVSEVLVIDAHGPGGIVFEELHPQATLLHGRPITRQQLYAPLWQCDAVVLIGQHAMAGVRSGNQNHTFSSLEIDYMKLNGRYVGETVVVALWAGIHDVPVIFLSGDEAACAEAREDVPGIGTAAVKQGVSANVEITLSAVAARRLIQERIHDAVVAHLRSPVLPVKWKGPYCLEVRWKNTQLADLDEHRYGCVRFDSQTVQFHSDQLLEVLCNRHRPLHRSESPALEPSVNVMLSKGDRL